MATARQPKAAARRSAPPQSGKRRGNGAARAGTARQGERATYHHGNLRDALVTQGMQMLEGGGAASLSLRQVAERTGVSPAAPLHHFETKEALLAAIAAEGFRRLFEHRIRSLRDKSVVVERLLAVMMASVDFALANPALFHLMFGPEIANKAKYPELEDAATRSYGLLETAVADYLNSRGEPVEKTRIATLAAWTACHGLATILVDRQNTPRDIVRRDPERIGREVFGIFIAGLSKR